VVAADGFLNWVRNSFGDLSAENNAQKWRNFFSQNIGMFLRNAVIYEKPVVQFYEDLSLIPQSPIATFTKTSGVVNVRLTPNTTEDNIIYSTNNPSNPHTDVMPQTIEVYGLVFQGGLYWLFIPDGRWTQNGDIELTGRLVWSASNIAVNEENLPIDQSILDDLINIHGSIDVSHLLCHNG